MSSGLPTEVATAHCLPAVLTLSNKIRANISTLVIQASSFERLWKDNLMPLAEFKTRQDTWLRWKHKTSVVEVPYAGTAHQDQYMVSRCSKSLPLVIPH